MTAARLEELAGKCDEALASETPDIASVLELADIADLARCARGWAKVEELLMWRRSVVLRRSGNRRILESPLVWADTIIDAVEAAEVGK